MKKLLKKLFGRPAEITEETTNFIFIERLTNGKLRVTVSEKITNQELLDITTKYYNEIVNPIYLQVQEEKREERKAEQLINGLVNNIDGVVFSRN